MAKMVQTERPPNAISVLFPGGAQNQTARPLAASWFHAFDQPIIPGFPPAARIRISGHLFRQEDMVFVRSYERRLAFEPLNYGVITSVLRACDASQIS